MLAALVAQSCAGTQSVFAPPPPPPDPRTQMAALEIRIFELVEAERMRIDPEAKALALDSELIGVARAHSADMAAKGYLAHAGPDGMTTANLIMDKDADFQGLLGENIAAQHFSVGYALDIDVIARRFVDSWLASPDHKDNLAFAAYERSGVGAAVNGDTIYVTQLFAVPLPPAKSNSRTRGITQYPDTRAARKAMPPEPISPGVPPVLH